MASVRHCHWQAEHDLTDSLSPAFEGMVRRDDIRFRESAGVVKMGDPGQAGREGRHCAIAARFCPRPQRSARGVPAWLPQAARAIAAADTPRRPPTWHPHARHPRTVDSMTQTPEEGAANRRRGAKEGVSLRQVGLEIRLLGRSPSRERRVMVRPLAALSSSA